MGQLDVHIRHGGGGGPDLSGLIGAGILCGVIAGVAMAVMEFALLIAVVLIAVLVIAAAGLAWWLITNPARKARFDEAYRAGTATLRAADEARALQRQAFALELARASAPVINNIIDPSLIAAAVAGAQLQPQPVRVLRGEVEK